MARMNALLHAASEGAAEDAAPGAPGEGAGGGGPRYLQVAGELRRAIADGTYPVGARLPTELELCARFAVSRFTAREAVRVLAQAGLVTRRQRVGTVVVATPDQARFAHGASSLRDLQQYAADTELRLAYVGKVALGRAQALDFGAAPGDEWIYAVGVRVEGAAAATAAGGEPTPAPPGRPICVTRVFLHPLLAGIEKALRRHPSTVHSVIENEFGLEIRRVEQEIHAVLLDADDAANLGAAAGAPALRIVRRYLGAHDRLLEVAESVHPADRFAYRMQFGK